jgi:hypothetical protein
MQSMEPMAAQRATVRWPWLAMWIAATVVVALSVHVVMFDGLHVPHPERPSRSFGAKSDGRESAYFQ